jgi:D-alanyl-D-alanine endopeptidase (penicillin-binding protein 7)
MKRLLLVLFFVVCSAQARIITATSWVVADGSGTIIESTNIDESRSIASITKLMTAMVVLDLQQDLDEIIQGYTRQELLQMMLIHSDNHAAELLCENYLAGRIACIKAMNEKAQVELGLTKTHFVDPSGLGIMNVSTARELIVIVKEASEYKFIQEVAQKSQLEIHRKKRTWVFKNTNPLIATHDFIVSKTGYIRASGGCIVMMLNTSLGKRIVVLLNSRNVRTRIPEAQYLASK